MKSRYEVSLDGVSLASLDSHIYVHDIQPERPSYSSIMQPRGMRHGVWLLGTYREPLSVTVTFEVLDQNIVRREQIIQQINQWAHAGILTCNNHPDQYLHVGSADLAAGSAQKWTETLSVTFHAYEFPFWRSRFADSVTLEQGTEGEDTLSVKGTADAPVEITVANDSGSTCDELSITVGGRTIAFEDLGLADGATLRISYDEAARQSIMIGTTSARDKRTPESADDLLAGGGKNTVSFTADVAVTVTASVKGAWL